MWWVFSFYFFIFTLSFSIVLQLLAPAYQQAGLPTVGRPTPTNKKSKVKSQKSKIDTKY